MRPLWIFIMLIPMWIGLTAGFIAAPFIFGFRAAVERTEEFINSAKRR
jgi:hypothetical protein